MVPEYRVCTELTEANDMHLAGHDCTSVPADQIAQASIGQRSVGLLSAFAPIWAGT